MTAVRAVYKPTKFTKGYPDGLDDEKAEAVLIIKVFYDHKAAFITSEGKLEIDDFGHFFDCIREG